MTQIKATLIDHCGSDISTVNAARVSFGKNSQPDNWAWYEYEDGSASGDFIAVLNERDTKLVKYLAKHKHLSPFGHAFASFHVKAPIFVARQLVKHKFLRWNEISRRYVDDDPEFYVPDTWRGKAKDKKQGSVEYPAGPNGEITEPTEWLGAGVCVHEFCYIEAAPRYKWMLELGICEEQARMVLPQSLMTEWVWSGSLDAFASMCRLRCASDTQYESRIVADQISKVMGELFPVSWKALMESED